MWNWITPEAEGLAIVVIFIAIAERCLIEAEGIVYFKGPCRVRRDPAQRDEAFPDVDPAKTLITSLRRYGDQPFMVAIYDTDITTWWNGQIWEGRPYGGNKLHSSFGDMRREGSCWVSSPKPRFAIPDSSRRGRVCAR